MIFTLTREAASPRATRLSKKPTRTCSHDLPRLSRSRVLSFKGGHADEDSLPACSEGSSHVLLQRFPTPEVSLHRASDKHKKPKAMAQHRKYTDTTGPSSAADLLLDHLWIICPTAGPPSTLCRVSLARHAGTITRCAARPRA